MTESRDLSLFIGSWNVDACKPESLLSRADDAYFINKWVTSVPSGADIYVFGLQEIVDLESKTVAAKGLFKRAPASSSDNHAMDHASRANAWRDRLIAGLRDNFKHSYHVVGTCNLVGLFTCVFVKEAHLRSGSVHHIRSQTVMTGMGGTYGNKGAIVTQFLFDDTSFCFTNSHLPAHQDKVGKRNLDAVTILKTVAPALLTNVTTTNQFLPGTPPAIPLLPSTPLRTMGHKLDSFIFVRGGDGSVPLDYEACFFSGDLNYRIDLDYQKAIDLISNEDYEALWCQDQLLKQRLPVNGNSSMRSGGQTSLAKAFDEADLIFKPTYKYDPGEGDVYDTSEKRRIPAWCDRILYRDGISKCTAAPTRQRITQHSYQRYECRVSDHRPIGAHFTVNTKTLVPNTELVVNSLKAIEEKWEDFRQLIVWDSFIRWIMARLKHPDNAQFDTTNMTRNAIWSLVEGAMREAHGDVAQAWKIIFAAQK